MWYELMSKKKRKKKDFPNNYDAIAECPPKFFHSIPYDEFMDWKICGYEIPSSINSIIREQDLETGKVTEYVYQTVNGGRNRARKIMDEGKSEFVVCTHDQVHYIYPELTNEKEEDYDPYS